LTEDDKSKKTEPVTKKGKDLTLAKETLRDLTGPNDVSGRVKGGKHRLGPSEPSCDATCE
jgi:hypothetical protein